MTLAEVAAAAGLARPTARRLLLTLEELGLRPACATAASRSRRGCCGSGWRTSAALGLWDVARPHLEDLVGADR